MKAIKFIVLVFLTISFVGCFEINEEIKLKSNGSGELQINMDMGNLVDMMRSFMPPDQLKEMEAPRDTTIQMKSLIDTSSVMSPENKAILREGSLRMQMNINEKILKLNTTYPFKNNGDLQKLYASLAQSNTGLGSLLSGLNPSGNPSPAPQGGPDLKTLNSFYDMVTTKNTISRKLNKEKYAALATDESLQQIKQMSSMSGGMGEVKMNTVISLSAPAKKLTGSKAELSTDKKTVLIKNNLMDIFDHPEVFEFSLEY